MITIDEAAVALGKTRQHATSIMKLLKIPRFKILNRGAGFFYEVENVEEFLKLVSNVRKTDNKFLKEREN